MWKLSEDIMIGRFNNFNEFVKNSSNCQDCIFKKKGIRKGQKINFIFQLKIIKY